MAILGGTKLSTAQALAPFGTTSAVAPTTGVFQIDDTGVLDSTPGLNETLVGTNADDTLDGGDGDDVIYGLYGNDLLLGGTGHDRLEGDDGNDRLRGEDGNDTLNGGDGDDLLEGGNGFDALNGGAGNDWLRGDGGDDTLNGGIGGDLMEGGSGSDRLFGGDGNDTLYGGTGDDVVEGGDGDDYLNGGSSPEFPVPGSQGFDTLTGGAGNDTFHLDDVPSRGHNHADPPDLITDFHYNAHEQDRIFLDRLLDQTTFTGASASEAFAQGYLRVEQHGDNGAPGEFMRIIIDPNGNQPASGLDTEPYAAVDVAGMITAQLEDASAVNAFFFV